MDAWTREIPLRPAELIKYREQQNKHNDELGHHPEKYTCDECDRAPKCKLAFDSYNTEGDCLYSK